jgi:hypothetical protein
MLGLKSKELEDALPFAVYAKSGLLRSNATIALLP